MELIINGNESSAELLIYLNSIINCNGTDDLFGFNYEF